MPDITRYTAEERRRLREQALRNSKQNKTTGRKTTPAPVVTSPVVANKKIYTSPVKKSAPGMPPAVRSTPDIYRREIDKKFVTDMMNGSIARRTKYVENAPTNSGEVTAARNQVAANLSTITRLQAQYAETDDQEMKDLLANAYGAQLDFSSELDSLSEYIGQFDTPQQQRLFETETALDEDLKGMDFADIEGLIRGYKEDMRTEADPAQRALIAEQIKLVEDWRRNNATTRTEALKSDLSGRSKDLAKAETAYGNYNEAARHTSYDAVMSDNYTSGEMPPDDAIIARIDYEWDKREAELRAEGYDEATIAEFAAAYESAKEDPQLWWATRRTAEEGTTTQEQMESAAQGIQGMENPWHIRQDIDRLTLDIADSERADQWHEYEDEAQGSAKWQTYLNRARAGIYADSMSDEVLGHDKRKLFGIVPTKYDNMHIAPEAEASYQYIKDKYGEDVAAQYADYAEGAYVDPALTDQAVDWAHDLRKSDGVRRAAGLLVSRAINVATGIPEAADVVGTTLASWISGQPVAPGAAPWSPYTEALDAFSEEMDRGMVEDLNGMGTVNDVVRTLTGKDVNVPAIGDFGWGDAYQSVVSMADSILAMKTTGKVGFGANIAADSYNEAFDKGYSGEQSLAVGLASVLTEVLPEIFALEVGGSSIKNAYSLLKTRGGFTLATMLYAGGSMVVDSLTEAFQEGATTWMNQGVDTAIGGAKSDFANAVEDLSRSGVYMSEDEAYAQAKRDQRDDIIRDAFSGFVGAVVPGVTGAISSTAMDMSTYNRFQNRLKEAQASAPVVSKEATAKAPAGTSEAAKAKAEARLATMKTTEGEASLVDNAPVTVAGITKTGTDATVTVTDESGADRQVKLEEVTVGKGTQGEVYAYAADMATPELANTFRMVYRPDQDISQVANGMEYVYEMAEGGAPETFLRKSSLTSALNDDQFKHAYDLGKKRRVETVKAEDEKATARLKSVLGNQWKGGTLSMGDVVEASLTEKQREDVELVRVLAGISGYKVELFQSTANEAGRFTRENGSFNRATNTISLDVNAGRDYVGDSMAKTALLRTMSHEVTHAIKANSPAIYGRLQEAVLEVLSTQGIDIDERISAVMTRDSSVKSRADALEEIVSDACETMLGDSDVAQRFKEAHPEAARSLGEKILEFLKNLRDAIKKAFAGEAGAKSVEAKALLKDMDAFQKIAKIWTEGALQTSEAVGKENGPAMQQETETAVNDTAEETVGQFDEPAQPAEAHIDQRDWENVADDNVRAFQNDYKFARNWMGLAARALRYDVDATLPGMRFMNAEGEWNGQKRQTTDLLAYLKDEGKWTWDQIGAALDKIASYYENGDIETDMPNSRRIKRIELVLDDMLSNGYTTMDGIEIAPDRGWLEYKKELPGAEAQAIPENAEYGVYEAQYDDTQYSARVTDEDTLDFLDNQDTVTTYKTMQLVDGKLYPPMAAVVAGKYEDHSVLGTWEQATEHPELIKLDKKGKPQFNLNKGQGKGNVPAAYNPYMHSSNLVLNDQFSSVYSRPNLVTVECEVPLSELTSGYKAQYAKDAVGWHSWHTGTVAGALRKATGIERQVLLSRWIKPVRIVPDAEVAQMYKDLLDGTGVEVPDNVVPPALLVELKKIGVSIKESGKINADTQYSVRDTTDGRKAVVIDDDILASINTDGKWTKNRKSVEEAENLAKKELKKASMAMAGGIPVTLNKTTRNEFVGSKDSAWLMRNRPQRYADKLRSTIEIEEVVNATVNWKADGGLKHQRKDNFVDFTKGSVLLQILGEKYEAVTVVGVTGQGKHVLYDLIDLTESEFDIKKEAVLPAAKETNANGSVHEKDFNGTSIPQPASDFNPEIKNATRGKPDPDTEELLRIHNEYREAQNDLEESKRKLNELADHPKYLALIDEIMNQQVSRFSPEGRAKTREIRQRTKDIENELGITALSAKIKDLEELVRDLYRQEQDFEITLAQKREAAAIEKSGLSEADYFRKMAVKEFGYTADFVDAGYLLPNGKMLNFSGEKGKHFGTRGQDHRAIGVVFEGTTGSAALTRFMNGGNIRIMAESPGIDIAADAEPTTQQYAKIRDFVREYANKRFFNVDISDAQGIVLGSYTYNGAVNADRVVNDIKYYYENGSFREQSNLSDFLYSTRDPYEVSDREILANALESAAKDSTEKAWLQGYKNDLADMNATQQVLDENRAVVRELMFKKGRTAEESDRLKKAQERVKALADQLARKDKALIKIEAAAPIRAILDREGKKVLEKMRTKEREDIAAIRQTQENAAFRKRIARKVKRLDELLRNPTDQKHVPDNLKAATLDMLKFFTDDTSVFDREKLERVRREYAELTNRDSDTSAAGMYDEDTAERIAQLADTIGGQRLSRLNRAQLNEVMKVVDHFSHLISNANTVFVEGRRERVDALAEEVAAETQEKGIYMENRANMNALWKLLSQGQITPAYFFRRLGGAMGRLGNAILNGENRFGVNALKSRETMTGIMQKYNHKAWAGDKRDKLSFVTEEGDVISLTREQALSLYATDKRERSNRLQNASHLRTGGIIIQQGKLGLRENRQSNANAAPISSADMEKINAWLTAEQKAYADAMVEYISKDMSELGNETSQALHGYSKFGEGYYFPYRTSSDFRKTNLGDSETALLKSMGFTKSVIRNANTPIIVGDFTETVSEHVAKMLMYNSFAEAQDAFMRVYDHKLTKSRSVKSMIKTAWGKNITDYIEQFMRDVYGGITRDQSDALGDRLLSAFKKNAVLASASVAIQQPSTLMRAMAHIDPKYFVGAPKAGSFREAMNYAGTAVIKDIGSFDTNTGRSVAKWMVAEDYQGISEKAKALFTDADYRSDILGAGPEFMDQVAWGIMWNAVKREQAAKTGLDINSEALKEIAGRRFDEVMRYTQVYDSVMSRSQVMRSKTTYAKMLTAFMAEPTVTYNMFVDAWFDKQTGGKAKAKRVTRTMAALTGSILLNNLLKAIVAAARDDDDENETYRERYVKNFASNLVSDVNPLNYIAYAKDIMSIFQGYDVERSDISIISDMYAAMQTMTDDEKSLYERSKSFATVLGMATGLPIKNIWRDFEAGYNTFDTVKDQRVLREGWLTHAMKYGAGEVFGKKDTKANSTAKLLEAAISGDSRAIDGLREHMSAYNGMDEKEINSALANAIHEALEGGEIDSAQATALLIQYADHDEDEAETTLNKWLYKMDTGNNYSDMKEQFLAGEITEEDAVQARMEYGGVSEEKARKTVSEWQFEKDNDFAYDDMEEAFKNGDITKQQAIEARLDAGADEDDAYWDVTGWEYEKQTGNEWNGRATKLNAAMASGNLTTIEEAITELYDHNTWKNPSSELTGDITAYWKPLYVAATEAERKAMLPLIYDCYELAYTLNGEVYYGDDNVWKKRIKRWESD